MKRRLHYIDLAKGIAIVLVIIGHTLTRECGWFFRCLIFSFHMPLFFMLSGYTAHPARQTQDIVYHAKVYLRKLVLPAYLVYIIRVPLLFIIKNHKAFPHDMIPEMVYSMTWASGTSFSLPHVTVGAFGIMWFLIALTGVRLIHDALTVFTDQKTARMLALVILPAAGYIIGQFVFLPFTLDVTLCALGFYEAGVLIWENHRTGAKDRRRIPLSFLVWLGLFLTGFLLFGKSMDMADRVYALGPLSLVMGLAGSVFVLEVCRKADAGAPRFFTFLGEHSMTLYIIHTFDVIWFDYYGTLTGNIVLIVLMRLVADFVIMNAVLFVRRFVEAHAFAGRWT